MACEMSAVVNYFPKYYFNRFDKNMEKNHCTAQKASKCIAFGKVIETNFLGKKIIRDLFEVTHRVIF